MQLSLGTHVNRIRPCASAGGATFDVWPCDSERKAIKSHGTVSSSSKCDHTQVPDLVTWVRDTPLDRVVGMQQNTASPSVSSGDPRGSRCTASAASGVMKRMEAKPNSYGSPG